ncbi:MAG: cell division septal protein [Fusobacteria bacterium]|nr:MAG: cell division septal protein [Fusobacteriota bacterium]KAF0229938.1 MAG: cell division septal [Fusobacteriota bacterium]
MKGVYSLEPSQVEKVANMTFGTNIFLQNLLAKENAIKDKFNIIDKVKIKQELPNKIIIEVTEKQPKLVLLNQQEYLFIDANGEIINQSNKLNQSTAPILTGTYLESKTKVGQVLVHQNIRLALEFINEVPKDQQYLLNEIIVNDYGVAIYPTGSYKVLIGENNDVLKKLKTIETLLRDSELLGNTIDYIDVSNPDKIILKTKEDLT